MAIRLTCLLLLLCIAAHAQTLQGIVTDEGTHKPLYPVTVVNTSTQEVVFTNERGLYSIRARQGQVIAFSYIGYKSAQLATPSSVLIANVNVSLERSDYLLQEFKFRPGHLTKYQLDSAERRAIYKVPLQRRPPSPFASPVSAVAEKFSKRAKMMYRFQKNFIAGEAEKFIDTRYTPDLVTTLTGITGDTIGNFMYAYPLPYDFARAATELELKMWIRSNYKEWAKQHAAPDSIQTILHDQKK